MKKITVPVPDLLYERIENRAKQINRTKEELVSLWLWDIEEQMRNGTNVGSQRRASSTHKRCVSAGHDDSEGSGS